MVFIKLFISIFFMIQISSASFSDTGNRSIHNFSISKKILSKIHEEHPITFYCQCRYDIKKPNWKSCGYIPKKDKKRASRIEWEHILPASHFGVNFNTWKKGHPKCKNKKGKNYKGRKCTEKIHIKYRTMQADLYNLQPAIGEVNGLRSNYQIALIKGEKRDFGECDIEIKNKKFEPSENIRGDIARTYMYMEINYPKYIQFNKNIKKLITKWDEIDPVDKWECERSKKIEKYQGNFNNILKERCNKKLNDKLKFNKKESFVQNKEELDKVLKKNIKLNNNKGFFKGKGSKDALK